uniref:RING-type E3 ubiquitin transferase n=1 Tax=Steinernema glaseri TaxID=37863 RepID=A0A1I8A707_9BILA
MVEKRCRICYAGSSSGNPLYHPCKCSGPLKYLHSSCLLSSLKNKADPTCELCSHKIDFVAEVPVKIERLRLLCVVASFGYIVIDYAFRFFGHVPMVFAFAAFFLFAFYVIVELIARFGHGKRPMNYSKPKTSETV